MPPRLCNPLSLSLRYCKCLFISVLVVCGLMALVAFKIRPEGLVSNSMIGRIKEPSVGLDAARKLNWGDQRPDELDAQPPPEVENVQFLPAEDKMQNDEEAEAKAIKGNQKNKATADVEDQAPIYVPKVVPQYLPNLAPDRGRGDTNPGQGQGIVRQIYPPPQLPGKIYYSQLDNPATAQAIRETPPFVPERRLIHFDLKGAPPRIDYLQQLIPIIVQLGGTGLLLEYEDMFPYEGVFAPVAAKNHYSKEEIKSLLNVAKAYKLEVIPLVQTFGHLEYVLKLPTFSYLRENPAVPQALCPSQNDSFTLVQNLIDQIMSLHEGVTHLHIGSDEVFHIAECPICSLKQKDDLFLNHVHRVANYVRQKYKVTPIIWDDMLRHMTVSALEESKLGELVEPMVWVYAEDVYRFSGANTFDRYSQVFPTFWISSSFKGAFGETLVVPDVSRHLDNNLNWLMVGKAESPKFRQGLKGIAITGWQRYDHFSNLCEILPAGIPSMAVNLLTVTKGYYNDSLAPALYKALSCQAGYRYDKVPDLRNSLRPDKFLHDKMSMCFFPGAPFFKLTARFIRLEKDIEDYVLQTKKRKGWLTEYSVRHNYSSPARVDELLRDLPYHFGSLNSVARQTMETLKNIFDVNTISEWMEQKLLPLFIKLTRIQNEAAALKAQMHWPVRPLKLFDKWEKFGVQFTEFFAATTTAEQPTSSPLNAVQRNTPPPSAKRVAVDRRRTA